MKIQSVMQHAFSQVPRADIPRSSFDRSHGHKTTFDAGLLVPILVDEALPGDTFNLDMTGFARLATPIFPIMDNVFMETFFFFVPYRLLWDNWERFNGAQDDPDDSTDFVIPVCTTDTGGFVLGSIADYMGVPTGVHELSVNTLPFRAYRLIYNEWFRDQNLQNSVGVTTGDGPDGGATGNIAPYRRGKRHDYFTSCLPWPQKGDSVSIPLGATAPVEGRGFVPGLTDVPTFNIDSNITALYGSAASTTIQGAGVYGFNMASWDDPALVADLSEATAATINQLRQAFQIQKLLERDARGGTRYTEIVRAHFGVVSPDARLQRPEYLGGGSSPVIIAQVPQTSATDDAVSPQGNLAAYGTVTLRNHGFTKSFTEHGVIIGLVSVRSDITYQQGLERFWSRQTRYDFYWPALSMIGEQAVLNKEIYCDASPDDDEVFGYQERYAEYRYKPSRVSGLFRSNAAGTLDAWHLALDFEDLPVLSDEFIQDDPPIDRVIAVEGEPHFIFDSYFKMRCARPMPMFGVPGLIDHF